MILFLITRSAEYLYTKKLLKKESALVFSTLRSIFGFGFVIIMSFFIDISIDAYSLSLIFLISVLATTGIYYRAKAIKKFDVSYVTPMFNVTPLFVFIFAVIFLKEPVTLMRVIGIVLITISLYVLNISDKRDLLSPFTEFIKHKKSIVLIPIFLFSITAILDKYTLFLVNPLTFIFYLTMFFVINFTILSIITKKFSKVKKSIKTHFKQYFIVGAIIFTSMIGQFYATSLKDISVVNPLLLSSSLIVVLLSGKLFDEKHITRKIISTVILIIGITLITI